MAYVLATNITSPLGTTTAENYQAVKAGRTALQRHDGLWGLPEPFCASLFTEAQKEALYIDGLTRFESLVVRSVEEAMAQLPSFDIAAKNVIFILSTTKANMELLEAPGETAQRIAHHLGLTTQPIAVCNACISGVAAIILAQRLTDGGHYDYAVVSGADVQSRFTVSGFQSLKTVSADNCRPFDMERNGLNLGEAAATMIICSHTRHPPAGGGAHGGLPEIGPGIIRNDAYHVSSPAKSGEGAWLALRDCLAATTTDILPTLAFINAHGTATMFNDQMESVAIERAGLGDIPVNGLKGYYGHTLGAAGVLETVISIAAISDQTILATQGFEERGVSGKICVTSESVFTAKTSFVKMISGFGGGNATVIVSVATTPTRHTSTTNPIKPTGPSSIKPINPAHRVIITPSSVTVDGQVLTASSHLADLYRHFVGDYPRFYKMDGLSRLGFIASELLLQAEEKVGEDTVPAHTPRTDRAVVLMGRSSSIATDKKYLETIAADNFFPSPSLFIYTLPNIVTGETATRNLYHGETSFFLLPQRNEEAERAIAMATFQDSSIRSIITGWIDYYGEADYLADLAIVYHPEKR